MRSHVVDRADGTDAHHADRRKHLPLAVATCRRLRGRFQRAHQFLGCEAEIGARLAADTTWVRPELVIRAEFAGWTGDGLVRQASYKGIDLGKDPRTVVREVPGMDRV